jgi:hypothetical protein
MNIASVENFQAVSVGVEILIVGAERGVSGIGSGTPLTKKKPS